MYIKFWGTRGSIPTPLTSTELKYKYWQVLQGAAGIDLTDSEAVNQYLERLPLHLQQTIGGNTTCLEIRSGDQLLILDAGSGLRLLGLDLMQKGFSTGNQNIDLLITHTHWDHIQGYPFFVPAFIPGNRLTFYSPFADLSERLVEQQHPKFFPVSVSYMSASLEFNQITPNEWVQIGNFKIYPMRLSHPGVAYGYRIEDGQSCLVMASDSEYKKVKPEDTEDYVEFFRNADLLIFDAQYSLSEVLDKPDWGHSTAMMGAEFAHRAQAKRLALIHHDPTHTDQEIWTTKDQADAYLMRRQHNCDVIVAYEGLTLVI